MTRPRLTDLLLYTLAFFGVLSLSAACVLAVAGFHSGYGRFDWLVALLGLPASALLPIVPDILLAERSSLFNVVALPWIANSALVLTVYFAARPLAATADEQSQQ